MSSQRELVQAMIRRKVSKARKMREESRSKMEPRELVMRFLGDFDEKLMTCESVVEKYWLIESESQRLLSDLQRADPDVEIELMWFGDDVDNMRLEGVRVSWGEEYKAQKHLTEDSVFDIASVLFA